MAVFIIPKSTTLSYLWVKAVNLRCAQNYMLQLLQHPISQTTQGKGWLSQGAILAL